MHRKKSAHISLVDSASDSAGEDSPQASLSARAYQTILLRILRGMVPLGSELSRRKLALELGMSVLPVSEALQRLQTEGIVESRPRVGTRVRVPTRSDIRERYEIREALECQTARLFCRAATPRDRAELLKLARRVDAQYRRCFQNRENDADFLYLVQDTHARFHLKIAEVGGCQALRAMLETNQVLTFNWLYYIAAQRPTLPGSFHVDLATALCTGDEEAADRAMREHVRYGFESVVRAIPDDGRAVSSETVRDLTAGKRSGLVAESLHPQALRSAR